MSFSAVEEKLMSRRAAKVSQADIARALRAGAGAYQIEIAPDGTIRMVPLTANPAGADKTDDPRDWKERLRRANPDWK